jgi:hypothetical protein
MRKLVITLIVPDGVEVDSVKAINPSDFDFEAWSKDWKMKASRLVQANDFSTLLNNALLRAGNIWLADEDDPHSSFSHGFESRFRVLNLTRLVPYPYFDDALPMIIEGRLKVRHIGKRSIEQLKDAVR